MSKISSVPSLIVLIVLLCGVAQPLPAKPSKLRDGPAAVVVQPNTAENLVALAAGHLQQNAEELSGQFEGDMVLSTEQQLLVDGQLTDEQLSQRTGRVAESYRWPNNTVPVVLTEGHFTDEQTAYIYKALRTLESVSCLRFVNWTVEENFVRMLGNNSGCYSHVGHLNIGQQHVNLQPFPIEQGCYRLGTIVHEFLHTLGFYHMQSATERDDYVRIEWQHLTPGTENNFNKYSADSITNFGHMYDVTSIMHYGAYGFSKNGYATIIPNDISLINVMGQRAGMSVADIARLNTMYKCDA